MVEDQLHDEVREVEPRGLFPDAMVDEARDVGVANAEEQLYLSGEALIARVQGQLEGNRTGGGLCADGTIDGAIGPRPASLQHAPGPYPSSERKSRRAQMGRVHGLPREEVLGPFRARADRRHTHWSPAARSAASRMLARLKREPENETGRRPCDLQPASFNVVGETGFEPATPWSRTKCSTRLSHSPICSSAGGAFRDRRSAAGSTRAARLSQRLRITFSSSPYPPPWTASHPHPAVPRDPSTPFQTP